MTHALSNAAIAKVHDAKTKLIACLKEESLYFRTTPFYFMRDFKMARYMKTQTTSDMHALSVKECAQRSQPQCRYLHVFEKKNYVDGFRILRRLDLAVLYCYRLGICQVIVLYLPLRTVRKKPCALFFYKLSFCNFGGHFSIYS